MTPEQQEQEKRLRAAAGAVKPQLAAAAPPPITPTAPSPVTARPGTQPTLGGTTYTPGAVQPMTQQVEQPQTAAPPSVTGSDAIMPPKTAPAVTPQLTAAAAAARQPQPAGVSPLSSWSGWQSTPQYNAQSWQSYQDSRTPGSGVSVNGPTYPLFDQAVEAGWVPRTAEGLATFQSQYAAGKQNRSPEFEAWLQARNYGNPISEQQKDQDRLFEGVNLQRMAAGIAPEQRVEGELALTPAERAAAESALSRKDEITAAYGARPKDPGPGNAVAPESLAPWTPEGAAAVGLPVPTAAGPAGTSAAAAPPVPGATAPSLPATQSFGPGNDLRGTQINPTTDPRLASIQAAVDAARSQVGTTGPTSPEAARARELSAGALESMAGGPSREELAKRQFGLLSADIDRAEQAGIQNIGRAAAKFGRLGAGMTTNDLTGLEASLGRERAQAAERLSIDTAGQELGDRATRLSSALGAGGQFRNEDLAGRGANLAEVGTLANLEGQAFDQGLTGRNELRGERGWQNQMQQQSLADFIAQQSLQESVANSQFGRENARLNTLLGAASGADPTAALLTGANAQQGRADSSMDALTQWLQLLAMQQGGSTPVQSGGYSPVNPQYPRF